MHIICAIKRVGCRSAVTCVVNEVHPNESISASQCPVNRAQQTVMKSPEGMDDIVGGRSPDLWREQEHDYRH